MDNPRQRVQAGLFVFKERNEDVGFAIWSAGANQSYAKNPKFIELWMASIFTDYRGQGYGTKMIESFVSYPQFQFEITARCFRASKAMKHILKNVGFTQTTKEHAITTGYSYTHRLK